MLPWIALMVFFGTTISNIHDALNGEFKAGPVGFIALIVGAALSLIAFILLSITVKRHFDSII